MWLQIVHAYATYVLFVGCLLVIHHVCTRSAEIAMWYDV